MTIDELSEAIGFLRSQMNQNRSDIEIIINKLDSIDKRLQSVEKNLFAEEEHRLHNNISNRNYILFISPIIGAIAGAISGAVVGLLIR